MQRARVNYDEIAAGYDDRYATDSLRDVADALIGLAESVDAGRALEVGCGTGRWLAALQPTVRDLVGADPSAEMLARAREKGAFELVRGRDRDLTFDAASFDLVYSAFSLHHFDDPPGFIERAFRWLRPGGALAVVNTNPRTTARWFVYDYFDGVYDADLKRFPAWDALRGWLAGAGFERVALKEVKRLCELRRGRAVFDDYFLQKESCSQLALLSQSAYEAGLAHIRVALDEAGGRATFETDLSVDLMVGFKPEGA